MQKILYCLLVAALNLGSYAEAVPNPSNQLARALTMSPAKGCWQAAGTLTVTPESDGGLYNAEEMSSFFASDFVTNAATSGSTIEIKQKLAVLTKDDDGSPLGTSKSGSCSIAETSKGYFTLKDAEVNDDGEVVYRFLVEGSKTPEGKLAGVQLEAFEGSGEMMPGSGPGANTFFFEIK